MNVAISNFYRLNKYFSIIRIIIFKKPKLVLRIIMSYFRILVLKEKIVRKVEMGVVFDCQCNCEKCSSKYMKNSGRDPLSIIELKKIASEILELGAIQINLTGGEPLLADNIFEIIKCFSPSKVLMTINTNGILLTKDMIDKLADTGIDIFKISLDSSVEEEHDKSRGYKGSYRKALQALSYIKEKKGVIGQISTVCIKENLNSSRIWELVNMAGNYNALLGLTIPAFSGRWVGREDILLGEKEKEILGRLVKIKHVIRDTDEAYRRVHCPAGSEEFYLTCYGDVIPCPLIQISFGNVRKKSISEIWRRMNSFDVIKNKDKPGCLAGENKKFITEYLFPLREFTNLPVDIAEHPVFKNEVR